MSFLVGTIVISTAVGSLAVGTGISLSLVVINTLVFYAHDLAWSKVEWGKNDNA